MIAEAGIRPRSTASGRRRPPRRRLGPEGGGLRSRELCLAVVISLAVAAALLPLDPGARHHQTDRLLQALDAYDRAEADLQRRVIGLRLGLERGPALTDDTVRLLTAADRLNSEARSAPGLTAAAAEAARTAHRQAALALRLEDDNARLQRSLGGVSQVSALSSGEISPGPEAGALAAAMLRNDETLAQVLAQDSVAIRRALRDRLTGERARADAAAQRWRLALFVVVVTLTLLLLRLTARLKAHVRRVRRMARLEHLVAEVSAALIRTNPEDAAAAARSGLVRLARSVGATRAFIVGSGAEDLDQSWTESAVGVPPEWPRRLHGLVRRSLSGKGALLLTPRGPGPPELIGALRDAGVQALALAWAGTEDEGLLLLGLDAEAPLMIQLEELEVLRLALDAIGGALRRARLERVRADLERRLQAAGRMEAIGVFASGIAHNFNNILAAIGGYAEMASGARLGVDRSRHLAEIRTAVSRARTLVDRILVFGRRRIAPPRPVRLAELVAESISLLRAGHDGARLVIDLQAPFSTQVFGDPIELQQVLLNLGANALQASRPGDEIRFGAKSVRLARPRVVGGAKLPPGDYVVLSVEDDGAGMDPKILTRIFEPFFTTRDQGHGLGLATVGEIVRDHGGGISVSSAVGRGSRFRVYLPRFQSARSGRAAPAAPPKTTTAPARARPGTSRPDRHRASTGTAMP